MDENSYEEDAGIMTDEPFVELNKFNKFLRVPGMSFKSMPPSITLYHSCSGSTSSASSFIVNVAIDCIHMDKLNPPSTGRVRPVK